MGTSNDPFDAWLRFNTWIRENLDEQDAEDVVGLINEGWKESDAIAFVMENPIERGE